MLKVYKIAVKRMWDWLKRFAIALGVMLPGLILIAYMVITKDIDISWWIVLFDLIVIALWAPVPLYPMYHDEYTMLESYKRMMSAIWTSIIVVTMLYSYIVWICRTGSTMRNRYFRMTER